MDNINLSMCLLHDVGEITLVTLVLLKEHDLFNQFMFLFFKEIYVFLFPRQRTI